MTTLRQKIILQSLCLLILVAMSLSLQNEIKAHTLHSTPKWLTAASLAKTPWRVLYMFSPYFAIPANSPSNRCNRVIDNNDDDHSDFQKVDQDLNAFIVYRAGITCSIVSSHHLQAFAMRAKAAPQCHAVSLYLVRNYTSYAPTTTPKLLKLGKVEANLASLSPLPKVTTLDSNDVIVGQCSCQNPTKIDIKTADFVCTVELAYRAKASEQGFCGAARYPDLEGSIPSHD